MKKQVLSVAIVSILGSMVTGCGGANDTNDIPVNAPEVPFSNDASSIQVSDAFVIDKDTAAFSNRVIETPEHFALVYAQSESVENNKLVLQLLKKNTAQTNKYFVASHDAYSSNWNQGKPNFVYLNDGSFVFVNTTDEGAYDEVVQMTRLDPFANEGKGEILLSEVELSRDSSSEGNIASNGQAICIAWNENGQLKAKYFNSASDLNGYDAFTSSVLTVDTNIKAGASHNKVFMEDNGDVHLLWVSHSLSDGYDLKYAFYDVSENSWSNARALDSSQNEVYDLFAKGIHNEDTSIDLHITWSQKDELTSDQTVYYSSFSDEKWSIPYAVSGVNDNAKGQPSLDVYDNKVGLVWVEAPGSFNEVHYRESINGVWGDSSEVYDLGGNIPKINFDQNGNALMAFYATHTYFSSKKSGGNWSVPSKIAGLNFGNDIDMETDDRGNTVVLWSSNEGDQEVAFQIVYHLE